MESPPEGIYDQLLDFDTAAILEAHPELRSITKKLDAEEAPARFSAFLARVIQKALWHHETAELRQALCNRIIAQLCEGGVNSQLEGSRLVATNENVLTEITPPTSGASRFPRPVTPIWESSLFTGAISDPRLDHELIQELRSADRVDFLVAFIRWSGL
jgi:hypothetical protein